MELPTVKSLNLALFFLLNFILILNSSRQVESIAVMSIDLGSEFMKIAIVKPGVPMEIVLNKESRRKTPLVVSLRGIEREFGELAMSQAIKNPKTAYLSLTQILAKSLDSPAVKAYREKYPFYDIRENPDTKTIYFQHDEFTTYTPEELLAMIFDYARDLAADFGEQPIDAAVIAVPPFFNQAERKSILKAAELVNLKVLQLINTNIAAGLNYGVFRRKDFNSTGTTMMMFDMGSAGTVATVATFQLVKAKDDYEANPQLTIRGIGFDPTLGGNAFTMRLAKHLANGFLEKTKKDVFKNPKALLKIYKEAERVKNVLSANADHIAQIEGLMDDVDFKQKVTREEFEKLCADLFERVKYPIQDAIKSSEVIIDELTTVVLVGGGTRIPKVQDEILKATKKQELGKNLNTDEAPALGAVYQAAFQSKGYKVKKFYIKDTNVYPIVVDFERQLESEQTSLDQTKVRRILFDRTNPYPMKKIMTFNKHTHDFSFNVNYGDLSFLNQDQIKNIAGLNLTNVKLNGVKQIFEKHTTEESKGIKVHFRLDDSGVLKLEKIDISFEKVNETMKEESTLSKIGNKISSFFGSLSEDDTLQQEHEPSAGGDKGEDTEKDSTTTTTATPKTQEAEQSKSSNETNANATDPITPNKNASQPLNITIVKEDIKFNSVDLDLIELNEEEISKSKLKLKAIKEKEKEKKKRAAAINSLEAFIFDTKDKLSQDEFIQCSTEAERETIRSKLDEADNWLSEADNSVETKEFVSRLTDLKSVCKDVFFRLNEKKYRPRKLDELKEVLNKSMEFLGNIKNLTGEDLPLNEVEYNTLDKLINSTKEWRVKLLNEQSKVPDNEQPKLLTSDISDKIDGLKREVSYLVNKIKYFRPKTKKPSKTEDTNKNKTNETSNADSGKDKETTTNDDKKEDAGENQKTFDENDLFNEDKKQEETESKNDDSSTNTESSTEPTANPEL